MDIFAEIQRVSILQGFAEIQGASASFFKIQGFNELGGIQDWWEHWMNDKMSYISPCIFSYGMPTGFMWKTSYSGSDRKEALQSKC